MVDKFCKIILIFFIDFRMKIQQKLIKDLNALNQIFLLQQQIQLKID